MYRVQVGKGKGSYNETWTFASKAAAIRYYNCMLVHSGYKKRLTAPDGLVLARELT